MKITASVSVRRKIGGKFPAGSHARALRAVKPKVVEGIDRAFAAEADVVSGKPWAPRKEQPGGRRSFRKLLVLTGRMKRAALAAAAMATINGHVLYLQLREPKRAKYHQAGTKRMARRRFFGVSKAAVQALRRQLAGEAVRLFRAQRVD